jgi:hypothetical protein
VNHEQIEAWLALEGWQAVKFRGTGGPTLVNFSTAMFIGHFLYAARPLSDNRAAREGKPMWGGELKTYSDLNPEYFAAGIAYLMKERDKS